MLLVDAVETAAAAAEPPSQRACNCAICAEVAPGRLGGRPHIAGEGEGDGDDDETGVRARIQDDVTNDALPVEPDVGGVTVTGAVTAAAAADAMFAAAAAPHDAPRDSVGGVEIGGFGERPPMWADGPGEDGVVTGLFRVKDALPATAANASEDNGRFIQ